MNDEDDTDAEGRIDRRVNNPHSILFIMIGRMGNDMT